MTLIGAMLYLLVTVGRLFTALRAIRKDSTLEGAAHVIGYADHIGTNADAILTIYGDWKDPTGITDDPRKLLADVLLAVDGIAECLDIPLIETLSDEMNIKTKSPSK